MGAFTARVAATFNNYHECVLSNQWDNARFVLVFQKKRITPLEINWKCLLQVTTCSKAFSTASVDQRLFWDHKQSLCIQKSLSAINISYFLCCWITRRPAYPLLRALCRSGCLSTRRTPRSDRDDQTEQAVATWVYRVPVYSCWLERHNVKVTLLFYCTFIIKHFSKKHLDCVNLLNRD